MTTPDKTPIWPHVTYKWVEIGMSISLFVLGIFLVWQSVKLGPGWARGSGPEPGLWPMALTALFMLGTVSVFIYALWKPDERPFFEVRQEVVDLCSVGLPILASVLLIYSLGIFVTAGLYLAVFMFWYGRFLWYWALTGGVLMAVILWLLLRMGFNISMPMSALYYKNILPF